MHGSESALRVLHLAPSGPLSGGIVAYSALFRESLRMAGVEVETLDVPFTRVNELRGTRRYVREAVARAREYDLVHVELGGGSLREFYAARELGRRGEVPVCATLHDAPRPVWWPFNFAGVRELLVARRLAAVALARPALRLEAAVLASTDAIFTLSSHGADAVAACFPQLPPVEILPYPIGALPPTGRSPAAGAGRNGLVVGFYGYWYPGKGIEVLVDALAAARDDGLEIRARIWGVPLPGSGRTGSRYRRLVVRRIRRRGLDGIAELLGHLPAAAVPEALRSCDAIVLPYRHAPRLPQLASTSAALHEALAGGVPVVASDVRALRETLSHEETGLLVSPDDPQALLSALRRLHDEPGLRDTLRRGAEEHARGLDASRAGLVARHRYEALLGVAPVSTASPQI